MYAYAQGGTQSSASGHYVPPPPPSTYLPAHHHHQLTSSTTPPIGLANTMGPGGGGGGIGVGGGGIMGGNMGLPQHHLSAAGTIISPHHPSQINEMHHVFEPQLTDLSAQLKKRRR